MPVRFLLDEHLPGALATQSMPLHLAHHLAGGRHVSGIFVLRRGRAIGEVVDDLALMTGTAFDDEYSNLIVYIPLT